MKTQTRIVATLVASFFIWGILEALADMRFTKLGGTLSFVHVLLISALIYWWAHADSANKNLRISGAWKAALVLFGLASMPFYLYNFRPAERRGILIAKGFGLFAIACFLYAISYILISTYAA